MICLADTDDTVQDGALHDIKVGLGRLQALIQLVLLLPFLQTATHTSASLVVGRSLNPAMCSQMGR